MVLADVARAVLIFSMPFLAGRAVGLIYVVAALMGVFSALFNPGQIKLIGELVREGAPGARPTPIWACPGTGRSWSATCWAGVIASITAVTILGATDHRLHPGLHRGRHQLRGVGILLLLGLPRGAGARRGRCPRCGPWWPSRPRCWAGCGAHPALRTNLLLAVFAVGRRDDEPPQLLRPGPGGVRQGSRWGWRRWRCSWPWGSSREA